MSKDMFLHKSKSWDMSSKRVENARSIAELIVKNINLNSRMEIMDFGAGTGLLSFFVAQKVGKIVAVDNSPSMLEEFRNKSPEFSCKTEVIEKDLSLEPIDRKFDGIISSMTIHHIGDTATLFSTFHSMLCDGGFIAIADLDSEDGSFHSENTGVFHYGFDRDELKNLAVEAGFTNIKFETASKIEKPHQAFTVFLMIAEKKSRLLV